MYDTIIKYRNKIDKNFLGESYDNHRYSTLNFIPPKEIIDDYEKDYEAMKEKYVLWGNWFVWESNKKVKRNWTIGLMV